MSVPLPVHGYVARPGIHASSVQHIDATSPVRRPTPTASAARTRLLRLPTSRTCRRPVLPASSERSIEASAATMRSASLIASEPVWRARRAQPSRRSLARGRVCRDPRVPVRESVARFPCADSRLQSCLVQRSTRVRARAGARLRARSLSPSGAHAVACWSAGAAAAARGLLRLSGSSCAARERAPDSSSAGRTRRSTVSFQRRCRPGSRSRP